MRKILLFAFVAIAGAVAQGQTLDECRSLARNHYPEIRQYDLIAATEQYNLSNAARAWIPQVMLSGQATYQSATPSFPNELGFLFGFMGVDLSGMRKDQYKVAVDVSQNIWDGGLSKANRAVAVAEAAEQRGRVDVSLYDLMARVDNIYFGILLLDERVSQTESLVEVLEGNLRRVRVCVDNGVAMQSDADAIEAELLTARQTLGQVEASRDSFRRMLELLIGQPLSDSKLQRPAMAEVAGLQSNRPELRLLDAQSNRINAQRMAVNVSVMPHLSAFAQGYYGYPGMDMFKSMSSSNWSLNGIVGLRMAWNIGSFYTRRNNLGRLATAQQQVDVQRELFLFNSRLQAQQDDGEIARLKRALVDDCRIVELRRSVRMAAESKMENGVIDATDLLRKIADETNAALNRSTHEIELLQAVYRLKMNMGEF